MNSKRIKINEIELNKFYFIDGFLCLIVFLDSVRNDRVFKALREDGKLYSDFITPYSKLMVQTTIL